MGAVGPRRVRAVTHLDVDADGIQTALEALELVVRSMKLEGIHHITAITGDAPRNVDFYVRVLGLRLVKKSVNQDDPTVYHLFYADENGSAGVGPDVLRVPERARRAVRAPGMVHRIVHRVGSSETLAFWEDRLGTEGVDGRACGRTGCASPTPRAWSTSCASSTCRTRRWPRARPRCPAEHALLGFHEVHACVADPRKSETASARRRWASRRVGERVRGARRRARRVDRLRARRRAAASAAPGTIHHIAWASPMDEHEAWRERLRRGRPAGRRR